MSLALAAALCACSVLIDRDRFEDGSGGSTAGSPAQGGSPALGGAPMGGQGGVPDPGPGCVNAQAHVGFDPPNDSFPFLDLIGVTSATSVITEPASDIRHGTGAFRIALAEEDQYAQLRSYAIDKEDVPYWVGFSHRFAEHAFTHGTTTFIVECALGEAPWQRRIFGLELDPDTPLSPYRRTGGLADPEADPRGFDELDQIPGNTEFSDWAVHMKLSATDAGYFDVYHAGKRVFSALGRNVPDPEVETCDAGFHMRFGLYRWDGFGDGGADAAPLPQTLFLDEIVILQVDESPTLDAQALFTLDPDSGCFDAK